MKLSKAVVYSQPLNDLSTRLHYTPTLVDISSLSINAPAGKLTASASYTHKDADLQNGQMQLHLTGGELDLSKIRQIAASGAAKFSADLAADVHNGTLLLSQANADINATSLRTATLDLGDLHATARTVQHTVKYQLDSSVFHGTVQAAGETELAKDYATHARLTFGNLQLVEDAYKAQVDGEASVDGPVLNLDALAGRLQINHFTFEAGTKPGASTLKMMPPPFSRSAIPSSTFSTSNCRTANHSFRPPAA